MEWIFPNKQANLRRPSDYSKGISSHLDKKEKKGCCTAMLRRRNSSI